MVNAHVLVQIRLWRGNCEGLGGDKHIFDGKHTWGKQINAHGMFNTSRCVGTRGRRVGANMRGRGYRSRGVETHIGESMRVGSSYTFVESIYIFVGFLF